MRKRPLGLTLFGVLFVLWALRGFSSSAGLADDEFSYVFRLFRFAIVLLTLAVGVGLLQQSRWALKAYAVWLGAILVHGALNPSLLGGDPLGLLLAGLALVAMPFVALGFYLRGALKPEQA